MFASFQMMKQVFEISQETNELNLPWDHSCAQRFYRVLGDNKTFTINDESPIDCAGEYVRDVQWTIKGLDERIVDDIWKLNEQKIVTEILANYRSVPSDDINKNIAMTKTSILYDEYPSHNRFRYKFI